MTICRRIYIASGRKFFDAVHARRKKSAAAALRWLDGTTEFFRRRRQNSAAQGFMCTAICKSGGRAHRALESTPLVVAYNIK